jgi:GH24 family phage-related lysozyme (muramidase)
MTNGFTPITPVSGVTEDQLFSDDLGSLLEQLEGKKPLPYADHNGIPSVGIGLNLQVQANAQDYLNTLGIANHNERNILNNIFQQTWANTATLTREISTQLSQAGFATLEKKGVRFISPMSRMAFVAARAA